MDGKDAIPKTGIHHRRVSKTLIGPPVIGIWPKSFRISTDYRSNRHKTPRLLNRRPPTCPARPANRLFSIFSFLFSAWPSLIGPPVSRLLIEAQRKMTLIATLAIRIRPKPFRISTDSNSNRHKTAIRPGLEVQDITPTRRPETDALVLGRSKNPSSASNF